MVGVMSAAKIFGLRADPWSVISLALMIVLIFDPMACLAPGFWLSFFAVAILFGLHQAEPPAVKPNIGQQLFIGIRGAAHAQMAITFGLMPITVLFFQQIIMVGPLANALAIPVVSFIVTPLALAASGLALVWDPPWLFQLAAWVMHQLHGFLVWCAERPWAALDWPSPGPLRATLASLGVAAALSGSLTARVGHFRHLGWLCLLLLWHLPQPAPEYGQMRVSFIDVGQGSSLLIRTRDHAMLYDTGPSLGGSDAGDRVVMPVLRRQGLRKLDLVMVSHFDDDHSGGLQSILSSIPVDELQTPEQKLPKDYRLSLSPSLRQTVCEAGRQWTWDGVRFQVLFPLDEEGMRPLERKRPDRNARSCVLRVEALGGASLLLLGDLPEREEKFLVRQLAAPSSGAGRQSVDQSGAGLRAQVLLAPHHGSKTSTSQLLLDHVQPEYVVIQSGFRNRYGHPHPEVLERIQSRVLRTDLQGQIELSWQQGGRPEIRDFWSDSKRFWHLKRQ